MRTAMIICDMWSNHYCKSFRERCAPLATRINAFADEVRRRGGRVLHCPSEVVDTYYDTFPQRVAMRAYPDVTPPDLPGVAEYGTPLKTLAPAGGCIDLPACERHARCVKQHDNIVMHPDDLITDVGQEVYNFIRAEQIDRVLMTGVALNMCVLARPFGIIALMQRGVQVHVVQDLVDVFYSPLDPPYVTLEQARWLMLGYIAEKWCPIVNSTNAVQ